MCFTDAVHILTDSIFFSPARIAIKHVDCASGSDHPHHDIELLNTSLVFSLKTGFQ